jgi:hypothetical protein
MLIFRSSAILTIFQISDATTDPVTRYAALLSLVCAIMSLGYGCIYIVRFGTMRSMYKASRWAEVSLSHACSLSLINSPVHRKLNRPSTTSGGTSGFSLPSPPYGFPGLLYFSAPPSWPLFGLPISQHLLTLRNEKPTLLLKLLSPASLVSGLSMSA